MDIDRYNKISTNKGTEFTNNLVKTHIPKLKESDYKSGYVVRYFIQSAANSSTPIFEVNQNTFLEYAINPLFLNVSLDWRIKGTPAEVRKSNSASIRIASQTIPKIYLYLPNLLQFHQK